MYSFEQYLPTEIHFGRGCWRGVGKAAAAYGKRALIVYGSGSIMRSGLYDSVCESLASENVQVFGIGGVKANPTVEKCYEGIDLCRREQIDVVVALGGGSVLDSAKCICTGALYDGDVWELCRTRAIAPAAKLPLVTVVTMAGAGSETSLSAVISCARTGEKMGFSGMHIRPDVSFIDPALTFTLPPYQTAAGAVDIISHSLERIFTPEETCTFTERLCLDMARCVIHSLPKALRDPCDYEARAELSWAAAYQMTGIAYCGIASDGTMHLVEHELSAVYDCAHGAGLAVVMPAMFLYIGKRAPARAAHLLRELIGVEGEDSYCIEEGVRCLRAFFTECGMPVTLSELGVPESDIPMLARRCAVAGPVGHSFGLTEDECAGLLRSAK